VVLALIGWAALFGALPAVASAECPEQEPSSQLLSKLGDSASYFLLEGSSFESGNSGWSLINAEIVNEGNRAAGGHANYSVVINPYGEAISPAFCVSSNRPSFRFYAKQRSGGFFGGSLNVSLRLRDGFGVLHEVPVSTVLQGYSSWTLSPVLELAKKLPWWAPNNANVNLVFQPQNGSSWAIDEVLIDPYSR
jgi:hypothetical protein